MRRAHHSKSKNAACSALVKPPIKKYYLELLRYTAPNRLIAHGLTLVCDLGVPTQECIPLLYLPYYHEADMTSRTLQPIQKHIKR